PESDERQHLIAMFSKRVEPFRVQEDSAVLNVPLTRRQHYLWQSPFCWLLLLMLVLVGVWWGLHSWLNVLVDELLPTGKS
ncbi:DotU family type IV/VI secretion system protein, partial [Klebsiella quasipneumoniae]|nr:DotU family type IV/VI secretion system protein [Klebsiella quasipneumoniae]